MEVNGLNLSALRISILLAAFVLTAGCTVTTILHPLEPSAGLINDRLTGVWVNAAADLEDSEAIYISVYCEPQEDNCEPGAQLQVTALGIVDEPADAHQFTGYDARLNGCEELNAQACEWQYLVIENLTWNSTATSESAKADHQEVQRCLGATYSLVAYKLTGDRLEVRASDTEALGDAVEDGRIKGEVIDNDCMDYLVTAQPEELSRFIVDSFDEVFPADADPLDIKDLVRLHPPGNE